MCLHPTERLQIYGPSDVTNKLGTTVRHIDVRLATLFLYGDPLLCVEQDHPLFSILSIPFHRGGRERPMIRFRLGR